jgi:hypothetical protein
MNSEKPTNIHRHLKGRTGYISSESSINIKALQKTYIVKSRIELSRRLLMLSLLALVVIAGPAASVHGQTAAHLTMTVTGQSLTAGFNNTVTISLLNNYYSTIYDTDIVVSLPSGLTLVGDDHWHYNSIALGQTVTISFQVYAPTSAIGSTYQGTVTASYKQLGDISSTQESHALSFSVYGWINLLIYGVQLTPSTTSPGGNATISGNLLNRGNLAAYNTNVTVESEALAAGSSSSVFIGEVDPNISRPFSLLIVFKPNLAQGNYSITVRVSAIDNSRPSVPIIGSAREQIQIKKTTEQPTPPTQQPTDALSLTLQMVRSIPVPLPIIITGLLVGSAMKNRDRKISKKKLGFASVLAGVLNSGESYLLTLLTPQQTFPTRIAGVAAAAPQQSFDLVTILSSILVGALIPLAILGIGLLYSRGGRGGEEVELQDSTFEK